MTPLPSRKRLAPKPDAEPDAGPEGTTFARTLRAPPRFARNPPEVAGMAHEGESIDRLEDLSSGGAEAASTRVLATIEAAGMAHEGESIDRLEDLSSGGGG